jgi:thioredoxin
MEHLTEKTFKEKICDHESLGNLTNISFKGSCPVMIDFYAPWCAPCKVVSPVIEALSAEYAGKIDIYKIDTQQEPDLAILFGLRSIPSFLFIAMDGSFKILTGNLNKDVFKQTFLDFLGV